MAKSASKSRKGKALKMVLIFVYLYFGALMLLYFQQRALMYFPGGERPAIEALTNTTPEVIPVKSDEGISFDAWHWPAKPDMPTILFFHGNGQAYQYWVNKLMVYQSQGFGVFFTDYRGYGGVSGQPTEQGIYDDARAHIKALLEKGVALDSFIYIGESLGTGVATQMATGFPPKAIVFESPYSGTNDVAKGRYGIFPIDLLMKDKFRSVDKIGGLKMPKLFIHGINDRVIPIRYARALYNAAPEPKQFVELEKAGHNDLYDHGAQLHIIEFLSTLVNE